ncbi:MAG: hypothetical protein J7L78_03785, partial [Dehalococcoidales bacterium]|nr:hypothetical protein [Dehalococcoidales bacterium]
YRSALDEAELLDFQRAVNLEGLDDEIAILRLQIKALLAEDGAPNLDQLIKATNALARLVSTRYHITKHDKKGIKDAIGNVLRDIAVPLGLGIATKKL